MRTILLAVLALVGCGDDDGHPSTPQPDAAPVQLSGCDDPALWTFTAPPADASADIGGNDFCHSAQFPLRRALLTWAPRDGALGYEELQRMHVCWRVTDASPGSGWTAGQSFSMPGGLSSINVMGFAKPVTIEGRALRQDNTLAFAIAPLKIELQAPRIVESDASTVVAVMSADAWAEHDAVHLWGLRVSTDEVLDAATLRYVAGNPSDPITLHRVGGNIVRRTWSISNGSVVHEDLVIGPGATGRLTKWGNAAIVDNELVIFGRDAGQNMIVSYRVSLDAAPLEVAEDGTAVILHLPGMLVSYSFYTGASVTLPIGDGVLVPGSQYLYSFFFDGTMFRRIMPTNTGFVLDDQYPYTPRAEDLARIGTPVAEMDSVIFGDRGFLVTDFWRPWDGDGIGPRAATFAELIGDGHLGPLSSDNAAYVVVHDSGAELYAAPYGGFCEPI